MFDGLMGTPSMGQFFNQRVWFGQSMTAGPIGCRVTKGRPGSPKWAGATEAQLQISPTIVAEGLTGWRTAPRRHPFFTGLQPPEPHIICPDACGFDEAASTLARSGKSRLAFCS